MSETRVCGKCDRRLPLAKFEIDRGTHRRSTCRYCRGSKQLRRAPVEVAPPTRFTRALDAKRYIITSAQNATPVHEGFIDSLKVAAEHLDAELVVIPLRYKNPTSVWSPKQESDDWWDEAVVPFLHNTRKKLNPNLILAADVKIQPTASSPLTGFESLTGAESCIIGHPKMQLRSVAVPSGRYPKILTTTGACTKRNYTDSKAGKLGAFHHFLGAIVVDIEGKTFHLYQINADRTDGSFTHLAEHFSAEGVTKAPPALALALGDLHARFTCPKVKAATFGPDGIVETLDVQTVIVHDTTDGYANNPHHLGNPFIGQAKRLSGFGSVRDEIVHTVEFLKELIKDRKAVLVSSNHDNFLARWVIREDWKRDPENAAFYLETAQAMLSSVKMTPGGTDYADPFRYWMEKLGAPARCLGTNESFKIADIECGMHGDRGPNGARGSAKNLSRLGTKNITGHGHSPEIEEGHYRVGTSTPLRLEYNAGPSSWQNTHCVIYATGKRSLITIVDGKWRANQ